MKRSLLALMVAGVVALTFGFGLKVAPSAEAAPPGAAYNLSTNSLTCTQASFTWASSGQGTQQWLDLSHWNGYYWQWQNAGPFGTFASSYTWSGLQPNTTYYVRVNTGTYYGAWLASDWVRFDTPSCQQPCSSGTYAPSLVVCPPQNNCPGTAGTYIVPQVVVRSGCVWTDQASYFVGQQIVYCYRVSQPMNIRIVVRKPDGSLSTVTQGFDDGRGDCLYGRYTGLPQGTRTIYMYGPNGRLLDTAQYTVN